MRARSIPTSTALPHSPSLTITSVWCHTITPLHRPTNLVFHKFYLPLKHRALRIFRKEVYGRTQPRHVAIKADEIFLHADMETLYMKCMESKSSFLVLFCAVTGQITTLFQFSVQFMYVITFTSICHCHLFWVHWLMSWTLIRGPFPHLCSWSQFLPQINCEGQSLTLLQHCNNCILAKDLQTGLISNLPHYHELTLVPD